MNKNVFKFFLNYLPNMTVIVFIGLILIMVIIAMIDAILGSQVNATVADIILSVISYIGAFVLVASVTQWITNLIWLIKADLDKEVKSKWRYFMFLFFIFANVDFYEAFIADQNAPFRKVRSFFRVKSTSMFHP